MDSTVGNCVSRGIDVTSTEVSFEREFSSIIISSSEAFKLASADS